MSVSRDRKVEREPLAMRVTKTLRDAITGGDYPPGERLVEEDLARRLGVSRNLIREAFHRLETEGLIENDHYRGRSVIKLARDDMAEIISLRVTLECHAIELAIKNLTETDKDDLRGKANALLNENLRFKEYNEADLELHRAVVRFSRSKRLEKFLNELWGPFYIDRAYRDYLFSFSSDPEGFVSKEIVWEYEKGPRGHQVIVEQICQKNVEGAQRAMREHILRGWGEWMRS
ncbi:MAG: GntR family transcriptional regulator [Acidobacteria bacterium]|nr:GntR family transcriptional regulator [Acidobacteriota bacterium]MCI0720332.1 GntR family transcriptional regulator [Acidobacteriota bacterium]